MPLFNNYVPPVRVNKGAPTSTGTVDSTASMIVNTTAQTAVDGNGQATTDGYSITSSVNGAMTAVALQNKSNGTLASSDLVFFNDATTDKFNGPFFDIGFTSSTGANPSYPILPIGGYMFTTNNPIGIGTLSANDIIFHTNGAATSNEMLRIKSAGAILLKNTTATPAGGSSSSYLGFGSTTGFGIYFGSGVPTVSAGQGSLYLRSDGSSTSTRMYVNTNGTTGWTAVTTAT